MPRLPIPAQTRVIWLFASISFLFLFAVRDRNAAWPFVPIDASGRNPWLAAAVFTAFGALCLWQQLRRFFLTASSQLQTFFAVWLLFAVLYPLLGGLVLLATDTIVFVGPFASNIDWRITAQSIAAGQLAFLGAMAASLIWNADEPGFGSIRLARDVVLQIANQRPVASRFRQAQLNAAIDALLQDAPKLSSKLLDDADANLLDRWWRAAGELKRAVSDLPDIQFASFDWSTVEDALKVLRTSK